MSFLTNACDDDRDRLLGEGCGLRSCGRTAPPSLPPANSPGCGPAGNASAAQIRVPRLLYDLSQTAPAAAASFRPDRSPMTPSARIASWLSGHRYALRSTSAPKPPKNRACFARPARLSARSGRSRPIFDPVLAEFRAEPVRTILGAALRRRPCAAPRARALSPLRNYLPTGPSLSHLSFPRTPQRSGAVASRSVLARIWRLPGPQKHHRPIPSELEAEKVLLSPESRVTSTGRGSRAVSSARTGRPSARSQEIQIRPYVFTEHRAVLPMNIVRRPVAVHSIALPPRNRRFPRVTGSPATAARWTGACLPGLLDSE